MKLSGSSAGPLMPNWWTRGMPASWSARPRVRSARVAGPLALAPLGVALAFALASCGGGSSKAAAPPATTTTTTTGAGGANRAALQAFTSCMSQHGVTIPTFAPRAPRTTLPGQTTVPRTTTPGDTGGGGGGGGRGFGFGGAGGLGAVIGSSDPNTQAAVKACEGQLPAGTLQQLQQGQTAIQAYVKCMASHGVTVTGPGGGFRGGGQGGGGTTVPGETTLTTTPQYAAANQICRALLPQRGPGNGGGPTTTGTVPPPLGQ
jgi:hypothetical protein